MLRAAYSVLGARAALALPGSLRVCDVRVVRKLRLVETASAAMLRGSSATQNKFAALLHLIQPKVLSSSPLGGSGGYGVYRLRIRARLVE